MISANSVQASGHEPILTSISKVRGSAQSAEPSVLVDIYQEEFNIVIWQRSLSENLQQSVESFLLSNPQFQMAVSVTPQAALAALRDFIGANEYAELGENVAGLVDMFCCLFDLKRAGLRLTALDSAMCPRFHVDRVPCRLVSTYQGVATEWLPHQVVDRTKLGAGNNGFPDSQSGLFQSQNDIQQLGCGDVGLLKGEMWEGNENAGLVHRSPSIPAGQKRLLLTLDFMD